MQSILVPLGLAMMVTPAFVTPTTTSAPSEFAGQALGAPFALPECKSKQYGTQFMYDIDDIVAKPCFKLANGKPRRGYDAAHASVRLVLDALPPGIDAAQARGEIVAARLEGLAFGTVSAQQSDTYDALERLYGPAHSLNKRVIAAVDDGEPQDGIEATWAFDNLAVTFSGIADEAGGGSLVLRTPAAIAAQESRAAGPDKH